MINLILGMMFQKVLMDLQTVEREDRAPALLRDAFLLNVIF